MSPAQPPVASPEGQSRSGLPDAVRVLLVEDNAEYARMVERTLDRSLGGPFEVEHTERLDAALGRIEQRDYDVMLVDLGLPDGYGAFTLGSACVVANHLPVLVLTGNDDEELSLAAVRSGAQDYLVKDRIDRRSLAGTILRAIERHRRLGRHGGMSRGAAALAGGLVEGIPRDPVTGLVSEVIFSDRLTQAIARAERTRGSLALMLLRHDDFLVFETLFGDELSRQLLRSSARALRPLVRRCDTLTRVGEQTFAAVVEDPASRDSVARLGSQMLDALAGESMRDDSGLQIAGIRASMGIALYPEDGTDLETLVESAAAAHQAALDQGGGRLRFHGE